MTNITRRTVVQVATANVIIATEGSAAAVIKCFDFLETEEGPFFPIGVISTRYDLTRIHNDGRTARGSVLHVEGKIFDSACNPIPDASVVIWQTDDSGRYRHPNAKEQPHLDPNFAYYARALTDRGGSYQFKTIFPKPYVFQGLRRARHIHFEVTHHEHGRLTSEMYFAGEDDDRRRLNDKVWLSRNPSHRDSLIESRSNDNEIDFRDDGHPSYRFDLRFFSTNSESNKSE